MDGDRKAQVVHLTLGMRQMEGRLARRWNTVEWEGQGLSAPEDGDGSSGASRLYYQIDELRGNGIVCIVGKALQAQTVGGQCKLIRAIFCWRLSTG